MKQLTLLALLLVPLFASADNYVPPKFPGGEARMDSFVKANLKIADAYLSVAKNKYVAMTCNIDTTGRMTGIKVISSQILSTAQNDVTTESRRVLTMLAETYVWNPAQEEGEKVSVMQNITFLFNDEGAVTAKINSSLNKTIDRDGNEIWVKHDETTNKTEQIAVNNQEKRTEEKPIQEEKIADVEVVEKPKETKKEEPVVEEIEIVEDDEEEIFEMPIRAFRTAPPPPPIEAVERGDEVFTVVEVMPQYPGGQAAMDAYVAKHFKMPAKAVSSGAEGRIYIEFVVDVNGKMKEIKLLKDGVGDGCGEEALRVIKLMASEITWTPGEQLGKRVNVRYRYPIVINNTQGSGK